MTSADGGNDSGHVYTEANSQPIGKRQAMIALPLHQTAIATFIKTIEQTMGARASKGIVCEQFHAPDFRVSAQGIVSELEHRGYNAEYTYATCMLEVRLPVHWAEQREHAAVCMAACRNEQT